MSKATCFVVMGYGVKADYSTGRELDLDKTYKNIIKPAVEEAGLICVRADEIRHSGVIDLPMYQNLYTADVVIADLSTYNSNAFYELGIRHALKPHTTITISEKELIYPFDLEHIVIRSYEHLGKDIGYDEVVRFRKELKESIEEILQKPTIDSPVYTFLPKLQPPQLLDIENIVQTKNSDKESLSGILESAKLALDANNFTLGQSLYQLALKIDPKSTYIIQKMALATYKSKVPDTITALNEAIRILSSLRPDQTTDPETLGLSGAIHKQLWELAGDRASLDKAIYYYEKGFYIKNDYYNGINLAYLLNVRGSVSSKNDSIADYVLALRVRLEVVTICEQLLINDFENRSDKYWIIATLEEAYFGLSNNHKYSEMNQKAEAMAKQNWERQTTESQISKLGKLLEQSPLQ